jgi:hypothetical protein
MRSAFASRLRVSSSYIRAAEEDFSVRRRTLFILISLLALAVVAPGATVAKRGGTDRPSKGNGSGTTTFNVATSPFPGSTEGTARLSHLGKTSYSSTFAVTLTGPDTFTITGTQTLVAANGDRLFLSFTGTGTFTPFGTGQTSEALVTYTVTGGTGRFDGASGILTGTVSTIVVSVDGSTATGTHTFTAKGKISY